MQHTPPLSPTHEPKTINAPVMPTPSPVALRAIYHALSPEEKLAADRVFAAHDGPIIPPGPTGGMRRLTPMPRIQRQRGGPPETAEFLDMNNIDWSREPPRDPLFDHLETIIRNCKL